uniref:Disease resistance protein RPM1-like n=1 Tax=Ananas comosus var. bracteatus TaxID=296719 RepID=A0A6V7QBM7_ANACO|nr:unnamed protein product [Ananas comosus var. bracteatus]
MVEVAILLAIEKLGLALGTELLNQASSLFSQQLASLAELPDSMERIRRELHVMQGFLCGIDRRDSKNQALEAWIEEVRKVAYIIEDIVDEYIYLIVQDQQRQGGVVGYMKQVLKQPKSFDSFCLIASQLERVEKDLDHLSRLKDRWTQTTSIGHSSTSDNVSEWTQHPMGRSSPFTGEENLVGIDENRRMLTNWLRSEKLDLCIITVWGMGGLRKTTLVTNVYKRESRNFDCHAWISISQTFKVEDLLRKMITELFGDQKIVSTDIATMDDRKLKEKQGSRIFITTRIAEVASLANKNYKLELKPLSDPNAWKLFCKRAFWNYENQECPPELEKSARDIVDKCEGLPLAIVSLGNLLSLRENSETEWKRVYDQLNWELANDQSLGPVRNILNLSFNYLPKYLKNCFLSCSMFPEVKLLPKSIGKLSNLLILDLYQSAIQKLPREITNLKKLRHMFVERVNDPTGKAFRLRSGVRAPKGLWNLKELQTLQAVEASSELVGRLGNLTNLRSFRIWNVKEIYSAQLCASLSQMRSLFYLSINASDENEFLNLKGLNPPPSNLKKLNLAGRLAAETLMSPLFRDLRRLCLSWCQLTADPLPSLAQLSNLTFLRLRRAYNGEQLCFCDQWFPNLKQLDLIDLPQLKRVKIERTAMSILVTLYLRGLKNLIEVPEGIEFLPSLRKLYFYDMEPLLTSSLKDNDKLRHISSIYTI